MIIYVALAVYLAMCVGTYARVMSAQKIKYAFLPSLFAPVFSIYFLGYAFVRAKKESQKGIFRKVLFHLDDAMFLFVVLVACIRQKRNQDKCNQHKPKWNGFTDDVYSELNAY